MGNSTLVMLEKDLCHILLKNKKCMTNHNTIVDMAIWKGWHKFSKSSPLWAHIISHSLTTNAMYSFLVHCSISSITFYLVIIDTKYLAILWHQAGDSIIYLSITQVAMNVKPKTIDEKNCDKSHYGKGSAPLNQ